MHPGRRSCTQATRRLGKSVTQESGESKPSWHLVARLCAAENYIMMMAGRTTSAPFIDSRCSLSFCSCSSRLMDRLALDLNEGIQRATLTNQSSYSLSSSSSISSSSPSVSSSLKTDLYRHGWAGATLSRFLEVVILE